MLIFWQRRINTVQITDVLNSSKNWVMKWSDHNEKGKLTRDVAGKYKIIFIFIENYPKKSKYRSRSAIET